MRTARRLFALLLLVGGAAHAGTVTYLANEGALVASGGAKILFDPLFDEGFGQYRLMPDAMHDALMAGEAPFDDVDAVFVSHYHGDHFSARMMLAYLEAQPTVRLYAPAQAVAELQNLDAYGDVAGRVVGIALDETGVPERMQLDDVEIMVIRVPHSGWPTRRTEVENLVFRVTLADGATVAHFGDADANPEHFEPGRESWTSPRTDLAMPPYWFQLSAGGRAILDDVVRPATTVGTHVPVNVPAERAAREPELRNVDLFIEPGETRTIP